MWVKVRGGEQVAVLTLKRKKSSMNMAPKGRIPAMRMLRRMGGLTLLGDLGHWKLQAPS